MDGAVREQEPWQANFHGLSIRKWYTLVDETLLTESGQKGDGAALRRIVIGAALRNPYAGRHQHDLSAAIAESVQLGHEFGRRITAALGVGAAESYGKACIFAGPPAHKDALYVLSHYDTIIVCLGDAPNPSEIVLLFACATRGRLRAR